MLMNIRDYKYHLMSKNIAPLYLLCLYACIPNLSCLAFKVLTFFLMRHLCRFIWQRWQDRRNV